MMCLVAMDPLAYFFAFVDCRALPYLFKPFLPWRFCLLIIKRQSRGLVRFIAPLLAFGLAATCR
jgi:hypothetical protein